MVSLSARSEVAPTAMPLAAAVAPLRSIIEEVEESLASIEKGGPIFVSEIKKQLGHLALEYRALEAAHSSLAKKMEANVSSPAVDAIKTAQS